MLQQRVVGPRDMSEEPSAISKISPAPGDYDTICAALMHTERGRWFLQEYARRSRSADTALLLAAVARIEAAVCLERPAQVQQDFRSDLLDMAEAITRTRAEVALPVSAASPVPRSPQAGDIFAAAERIRDVTWAMRGHGFEPSTCDQLEQLAASILSASSLRDPTDHRARKLSEVLQYLEFRIDTLLDSCADGEALAPAGGAAHRNGSASGFVAEQRDRDGADAPGELPPSPQIRFYDAPLAIHGDVEGDPQSPPPAVEIAPLEESFRPPPDPVSAEPPISAQNHEVAAQTAGEASTSPPAPSAVAGKEPATTIADRADPLASTAAAEIAVAASPQPEAAASSAEEAAGGSAAPSAPPIDGNGAKPPDAFLPALELAGSAPSWRESPAAQAASAASREAAARLYLPEIELRPPGRAEPAELFPAQLAAAPMPQPADGDPLAALKAMSDNELIALFS